MSKKSLKGDTLIEVVLGFAIFSTVTAFAIATMNSSLTTAEGALELTLARNEIDSQSEALRFVHNSFLNDRNYESSNQPYRNLWIAIRSLATADASRVPRLSDAATVENTNSNTTTGCEALYDNGTGYGSGSIFNINTSTSPNAKAFVINTRKLASSTDTASSDYYGTTLITADSSITANRYFYPSTLNPRIVYTNGTNTTDDSLVEEELNDEVTPSAPYDQVSRVEGIWDVAVKENVNAGETSRFYDFHIYTCWYPPGAKRPTTIGTILRLYNPEYLEESYF